MSSSHAQTCAVLFADIAGSTELYEAIGDEAAKAVVTDLQRRIGDVAGDFDGQVHEIVGDEVMLCFERVADAADCALAIQRSVADDVAQGRPGVRIGLHVGDVLAEGTRLFGDTINVAARVVAIARGGQIITTEAVITQLPAALQALARRFDVAPLKGKREPMPVYDLPWQEQDLTEIASVDTVRTAPSCLILSFAGQAFELDAGSEPFSIGRDASNNLVVDALSASRRHASIAFTRGRFVITDTSTNGTYLTLQNGQVVFLRRESMPLWGSGRLALGASPDAGLTHDVDYRCI